MNRTSYVIEAASIDDLPILGEIEARATERFSAESLPPGLPLRMLPVERLSTPQTEGRILVARAVDGRVMGFALVESLGGDALLEELDVEPRDGRRGIGRSLVEAACDWAIAQGHSRIILSTFRDVPWNAPFYARLDFEEIPEPDWTRALREMREDERRLGFDLEQRVLMLRELSGA